MVSLGATVPQRTNGSLLQQRDLSHADEIAREERFGVTLRGAMREAFLSRLESPINSELQLLAHRLRREAPMFLTPETLVLSALIEVHNNLIKQGLESSANGHPTGDVLKRLGLVLYQKFPEPGYEPFILDCQDLLEQIRRKHLEWPVENVDSAIMSRFDHARRNFRDRVVRLNSSIAPIGCSRATEALENLTTLLEAIRRDSETERPAPVCALVFTKCAALTTWANNLERALKKAPDPTRKQANRLVEDVEHLSRELLEIKLRSLRSEIELALPDSGVCRPVDFINKMDQVIHTLHGGLAGTYSFEPLQSWVSHAQAYATSHRLKFLLGRLQEMRILLGFAKPYAGSKSLKAESNI